MVRGLRDDSDNSQTVISGAVTDQAALRGLLDRVFDLGLVLMSVRRSGTNSKQRAEERDG
jgi:hypothetical protein